MNRSLFAALALVSLSQGTAAAQGPGSSLPFTGYELALKGSPQVTVGERARFRGTAYRVRGLAELVPFSGLVRARIRLREGGDGEWAEVRADTAGRFEIEVPVAAEAPPRVDTVRSMRGELEVRVGPRGSARAFEFDVGAASRMNFVLRTDRNLYEAGEPVRVWAWLRGARSGRPVVGQRVRFVVSGPSLPERTYEATTGESGAADLVFEIPAGAAEGEHRVRATALGEAASTTGFRIGTRTYERVLATVEVEPEPVAPGGTAQVVVRARAMSGAPMSGAEVQVEIDGARWTARTDRAGDARVEVTAPAHPRSESGLVSVHVQVHHPAHGEVRAESTMHVALPLSLEVEAAPRHGGLIPEIDDVLYLRLYDPLGEPPPASTSVTVTGEAVVGGRAQATVDSNGLVEVPVRLPVGVSSGAEEDVTTDVLVQISGPLERLVRLQVPVFRAAEVAPTPSVAVVEPGAQITVSIDRRPSVADREVVLEVLERGALLRSYRVPAGQHRVQVDTPNEVIGRLSIRARAVHEDEVLEGAGTSALFIVRPASPDFMSVSATRTRWTVGETAHVTLHTGAGGPRRWAAVLVRDLAAHGGELPFDNRFLDGVFDRAMLDPSGADERRLLFAVFGAWIEEEPEPQRAPPLLDALGLASPPAAATNGLRDPWPLARELERRGIANSMAELEMILAEALDAGDLDAVTRVSGERRDFRHDLLAGVATARTLGDGTLTPRMITASDPSFTYDRVAGRVARARLVRLLAALAIYLDPGDDTTPDARMAGREPPARWLSGMVERGLIDADALADPWGGQFSLRQTRTPALLLSAYDSHIELQSPGPDGRVGTQDDIRDPLARLVPRGTPYATVSGEDELMRELATLSPVARTLGQIAASYERVSAEMTEDTIGDAVAAEVSEGSMGIGGLGMIGTGGGGGGSGEGYGYGSGTIGSRQHGSVSAQRYPVSGLASALRHRFPPSLLFRPHVVVDPSGTTDVPIPLADAITTYLVEVVMWREDGWYWSDSTRIEVDREVVVAAPVPALAHVGDQIDLPVRVANHGDSAQELEVRVRGDEPLGRSASSTQRVTVGPGEATRVIVRLSPGSAFEGNVQVSVHTIGGATLDAVRLPIVVRELSRRVVQTHETITGGEAAITVEVPAGSSAREGSVRLSLGQSIFPVPDTELLEAWAAPDPDVTFGEAIEDREGVEVAFAVGADWQGRETRAEDLAAAISRLTAWLDGAGEGGALAGRWRLSSDPEEADLVAAGWALLGLHPVARAPRRHDVPEARELVERLRRAVGGGALASTDPAVWALSAAALGWSSGRAQDRTRELIRRLTRHEVRVGDSRWLALEHHAVRATVLFAMAKIAAGQRDDAFVTLSTLSGWARAGHALDSDVGGLARAAVQRLMGAETGGAVTVEIDGEGQTVELEGGGGRLRSRRLSRPGRHRVHVRVAGGAPLFVEVESRYGLPWSAPPGERGPMVISLEGEVGGLGRPAELELIVRNRAPRTLRRPVLEIELPTGAELTEAQARRLGVRVQRLGDVLTLRLTPMRPGNTRRIRLPLRWSVGGRLRGLGIAGYAEDRPRAVTVVQPRAVEIGPVQR